MSTNDRVDIDPQAAARVTAELLRLRNIIRKAVKSEAPDTTGMMMLSCLTGLTGEILTHGIMGGYLTGATAHQWIDSHAETLYAIIQAFGQTGTSITGDHMGTLHAIVLTPEMCHGKTRAEVVTTLEERAAEKITSLLMHAHNCGWFEEKDGHAKGARKRTQKRSRQTPVARET